MLDYENYGNFRREAESAGLEAVTRQEFLDLVVAAPSLSPEEHLQRIRNSRSGLMVTDGRKFVQGYFAGSRDFLSKGRSLEDVSDQFVTLIHKDGFLQDYQMDFSINAQPWGFVDLDVSFGWRRLRSGHRINVRQVNKVVTKASQLISLRNSVDFLIPDQLNRSHKHKVVAVRGAVSGVMSEPNWVGGDGYFPYDDGEWPTCEVHLRGRKVRVFVHFGPYKNSRPLVDHPSFSLDKAPTVKELDLLLHNSEVAVIGSVRAIQKAKRGSRPMTDVHITATAIIEWEESDNAG